MKGTILIETLNVANCSWPHLLWNRTIEATELIVGFCVLSIFDWVPFLRALSTSFALNLLLFMV